MRVLILVIFLMIIPNYPWASERQNDTIVAIVNDEVITYGEVLKRVKDTLIEIEKSGLPKIQKEMQKKILFRQTIRVLIDEKLTLQEAKKYNIEVSEESIREQIKQEFTEKGKTFDGAELDVTELVRNRLTLRQLFQKKTGYSKEEKIRAGIDTYVSPEEIREHYKKNIGKFSKPNNIKTRIITLFYSRLGGREKAITQGQAIIDQLKEGASFEELAKQYSHDTFASEGGTWPRVTNEDDEEVWDFYGKGVLYEEVEEVAFQLKEGEFSQRPIPIDEARYCQIIQLVAIQPGEKITFAEAQESIRAELRYAKIVQSLNLMRFRLREKSFIWPPEIFADE